MTMEEYKRNQNDIDAHTDSQLYSCGSLAPKLRKGGAGRIGCSSCAITRPKAPWEATDGSIYLLRELIHVGTIQPDLALDDQTTLMPILTELMDVCRVQHFPQSDDLRATLWRQLPQMAQDIGKTRFKRLYLEIILDPLFQNLDRRTASALSKHAAGQCAEELSELVGPLIFKGRLDDFQRDTFERVLRERRNTPAGPSDAFSPFGPTALHNSLAAKTVSAGPMTPVMDMPHPGVGRMGTAAGELTAL